MADQQFGKIYGANPAANYEQYFVPAIGAPMATDLIGVASLLPGERVLDVACGTGVVTRLAFRQVSASGTVAGLDINPGMLAAARSVTPAGTSIEWHEAGATAMPFQDGSFDVVLCQMGLQFMPDKHAALHEMRRVLAPGGRLIANMPGPTPEVFKSMEEVFEQHIGGEAAGFVNQIFSLHDSAEIRNLFSDSGFHSVSVQSDTKTLQLPEPEAFLWQYIHSTPLAGAVAQADDKRRQALEREVVQKWQPFVQDNSLVLQVRMVTAAGRR